MKSSLLLILVIIGNYSLTSQVSARQVIEGTGVGTELGLVIQGTGHHGIQVTEAGGIAGAFLSSQTSTDAAILAQQTNNSGLYSDLELQGSRVIGSNGNIYVNVDNDTNNNTEDPSFFGVIHGDKDDVVFLVDQDGNTTADGNLSAKRIRAQNLDDTQPDLQLLGPNAFINNSSFNSNLRIESTGSVSVKIGQSNGSNVAKFAILDQFGQEGFSVDELGITRVYTTLVTSDRNKKEHISTVSSKDVLDQLIQMPIYQWNYKKRNRQHIGPMAQDFLAAFNLGNDDTTISSIDADGISLAAIKGLYELMQEELAAKSAEITNLQERMAALEAE